MFLVESYFFRVDEEGPFQHLQVIQFKGAHRDVIVKPHGNRKKGLNPYRRVPKKVMRLAAKKVREVVSNVQVTEEVRAELGDMAGPFNPKTSSYLRAKLKLLEGGGPAGHHFNHCAAAQMHVVRTILTCAFDFAKVDICLTHVTILDSRWLPSTIPRWTCLTTISH